MIKLPPNSHIITGKSSWHIDSAIRNELGWGSHTVDTVQLTCDSICSHAALYVGEDGVIISLVADPNLGSSSRVMHDANYRIDFTSILDVVMKDSGTESQVGSVHVDNMLHDKFTTELYLKSKTVCSIDSFHSDFLGKQLKAAWEADLVRRSSFAGKLVSDADVAISIEYHREAVECLRSAVTYSELIDVAEDFSTEVLLDLELKALTLESREMLLLALEIIDALVSQPAIFSSDSASSTTMADELLPVPGNCDRIMAREKIRPTQRFQSPSVTARSVEGSMVSARSVDSLSEIEEMTPEQNRKLKLIAVQRLKIVNSMLKLISSVLFSSESIFPRIGVLLGPSPLEWAEWLQVLVPDLYKKICVALGCSETSEAKEIDLRIQMNLEEDQTRRSQRNTARDTNADDDPDLLLIGTPRRALNTSSMHNIAEEIMTPRSARGGRNSARGLNSARGGNQATENPFVVAMQQLTPVCQSVKDLQAMLFLDLYRITILSKAQLLKGQKKEAFTLTTGETRTAGLKHIREMRNVGDVFIRQPDWEDALEQMIARMSTVLEDMLSSGHITLNTTAPNVKAADAVPATPRQHSLYNSYGSGNRLNSNRFSSEGLLSASFSGRPSPFTPNPAGSSNNAASSTPRRNYNSSAGDVAAASSTINAVLPSPSASMRKTRQPIPPNSPAAPAIGGAGRTGIAPTSFRSSFNLSGDGATSELGHARSIAVMAASSTDFGSASSKIFEIHSPYSRKNTANKNSSSVGNNATAGSGTRPMLALPLMAKSPIKLDLGGGVADLQQQESREGVGLLKYPLRTQEIIFFHLTLLLQYLAMDSSRVREIMRSDLRSYWSTILGIINQICPRPTAKKKRRAGTTRSTANNREGKDTTATERLRASRRASVGSNGRGQSSEAPPRSKYVQKFLRMFSTSSDAGVPIPSQTSSDGIASSGYYDDDDDDDGTGPTGTFSGVPGIIPDDVHDVELYREKQELQHVHLIEYGPPQYGLSASSWLLLLRSRQALERITQVLDFNIHEIVPPKQQQQHFEEDAAVGRVAADRNNDDDSTFAFFGNTGFASTFNRDNIHFDTLSEEDESISVATAKDNLKNLGLDEEESTDVSSKVEARSHNRRLRASGLRISLPADDGSSDDSSVGEFE